MSEKEEEENDEPTFFDLLEELDKCLKNIKNEN